MDGFFHGGLLADEIPNHNLKNQPTTRFVCQVFSLDIYIYIHTDTWRRCNSGGGLIFWHEKDEKKIKKDKNYKKHEKTSKKVTKNIKKHEKNEEVKKWNH